MKLEKQLLMFFVENRTPINIQISTLNRVIGILKNVIKIVTFLTPLVPSLHSQS